MASRSLPGSWHLVRLLHYRPSVSRHSQSCSGVSSPSMRAQHCFTVAGSPLFAGVCVVAIAVATHPAIAASRILGITPLVYLGKRSYGLYLWHWPIFLSCALASISAGPDSCVRPAIGGGDGCRGIVVPLHRDAHTARRDWGAWKQMKGGGIGAFGRRTKVTATVGTVCPRRACLCTDLIPATDATTYLNGATSVGTEGPQRAPPATTDTGTSASSTSAVVTTTTIPAGGETPVAPDPALTAPSGPVDLTKRPIPRSATPSCLVPATRSFAVMPKVTVDAKLVGRRCPCISDSRIVRPQANYPRSSFFTPGPTVPPTKKDLRAAVKNLSDRGRVVSSPLTCPTSGWTSPTPASEMSRKTSPTFDSRIGRLRQKGIASISFSTAPPLPGLRACVRETITDALNSPLS